MISFRRHILPNGLRIIHHYDGSTKMTALNLLYDVGSKDESPERTGFAHLFEHLMFGGSVNIPFNTSKSPKCFFKPVTFIISYPPFSYLFQL